MEHCPHLCSSPGLFYSLWSILFHWYTFISETWVFFKSKRTITMSMQNCVDPMWRLALWGSQLRVFPLAPKTENFAIQLFLTNQFKVCQRHWLSAVIQRGTILTCARNTRVISYSCVHWRSCIFMVYWERGVKVPSLAWVLQPEPCGKHWHVVPCRTDSLMGSAGTGHQKGSATHKELVMWCWVMFKDSRAEL